MDGEPTDGALIGAICMVYATLIRVLWTEFCVGCPAVAQWESTG